MRETAMLAIVTEICENNLSFKDEILFFRKWRESAGCS